MSLNKGKNMIERLIHRTTELPVPLNLVRSKLLHWLGLMMPLAEVGHVGIRTATELLALRPKFIAARFGDIKAAVGGTRPFPPGNRPGLSGTTFFEMRRGAVCFPTDRVIFGEVTGFGEEKLGEGIIA